jgi:hypothetical protein
VTPATTPSTPKTLKDRLRQLLVEYGSLGLWVYFGIFAVVLVGFAVAILSGAKVESAAGTAGTWGAAYVATKLTQPLRIVATLVLTPLLVRIVRRVKRRGHDAPQPPTGLPEAGSGNGTVDGERLNQKN